MLRKSLDFIIFPKGILLHSSLPPGADMCAFAPAQLVNKVGGGI